MSDIEILGLVAGFLVALGFIPQVVRVWKLKSAREISLPFNLLFLIGTTIWLVYGIILGLTPVIVWNTTNDILLLMLLGAKLKYGMGGVKKTAQGKLATD